MIVVSGQPRSGTSLMMRVLQASGIPVEADETRSFELSRVLTLKDDNDWIQQLPANCAIKVLFPLSAHLPVNLEARMLWMNRNPREQAKSQQLFSGRFTSPQEIKKVNKGGPRFFRTLGLPVLVVSFDSLLDDPEARLRKVGRFLGHQLDPSPVVSRSPKAGRFRKGQLEVGI